MIGQDFARARVYKLWLYGRRSIIAPRRQEQTTSPR